jgi:hypothetical protein
MTTTFSAFDATCANCDASADVDVQVFDATDGTVARDVFACEACAADISVPQGFAVTTEAL